LLVALSSFSVFSQDKPVIVTASHANIRETPSQTAKVVGKVKKGDTLLASANEGNWYYVVSKKVRGWIHYTTIRKADDSDLPDLSKFAVISPKQEPKSNGRDSSSSKKDEWQLVDGTRLANYYFNPAKARRYNDMAEIWVKVIPIDKKAWMEDLYTNFLQVPIPADLHPEGFSHALEKYVSNCKTRQTARVQQVLYSVSGSSMGGFDMSGKQITLYDAIPDSIGDVFLEKGCSLSPTN